MENSSASQQIDNIIKMYGDWKGQTISRIRAAIMTANPGTIEGVKWKMRTRPEGLPVWSHNGILCILETFKDNQKLVFFKGAEMKSLSSHFNARLNSRTDRAIEFHEGDSVDEATIKALVLKAVRLNDLKVSKK